ncbi:MAG: LysE family translocator [Actinomycetota bacterium]|nr:LysE family translocator [Actinomycetota bacterium]
MRSVPEFLLVGLVVTLTPGPATALILRVAARDGRRAALGAVAGNSIGVLVWAGLSAVGVSSLILASQIAYDVLRVGGAVVLVALGVRSILHRGDDGADAPRGRHGWRSGLITSVANPKLAVFFIALFPQFLSPHAAVLPAALAMAAVIVAYDVLWFSALAYAVDRAGTLLRPRVRRTMERGTGAVMVGLGVSIAAEAR